MRQRSSSKCYCSSTFPGTPRTTAFNAIAPTFTIFVVPVARNTQNLSALGSRSHSQSYDLSKGFELRLLISPLFLSLSAKHKEIRNMTKQESNCGRERCEGKFIFTSALSFPEMFTSMPTVEAFPFCSRTKFPDSKNL